MRIIISGAAGFIGSHLADRFCRDGNEVIGLDNLVTADKRNLQWLSANHGFKFILHDIINPVAISGPVDLVCNLACPASPVDFAPLNIEILRVCSEGTRNMLELAREKNAVFPHTSTSEVYGDPKVNPQPESYWGNVNPIGTRSMYDEGKRFAEAMITAYRSRYSMKVRIARIFNTFGPRMRIDDGRVVTNFIMQALAGEPVTMHGDGSQTRSFCYVSDQVEGLVRLSRCDYDGPINIGNCDEIPIRRLAEEVIELTGSRSSLAFKPLPGDDPKLRRPDITLARKILGWQPSVPRKEGLEKTIQYCRETVQAIHAARKHETGDSAAQWT